MESTGPGLRAAVRRVVEPCDWDDITSTAVRETIAYYESLRRDGCVYKADFEPLIGVTSHVAKIALLDYLPDQADYRYRLAGTALNDIAGGELTGRTFRQTIDPASAAWIRSRLDGMRDSGEPFFTRGAYFVDGQHYADFQAGNAPLWSADGNCWQCFFIVDYVVDAMFRGGLTLWESR